MEYCETFHPTSKADLATSFVERGINFCADGGTCAVVTPQTWLFLASFKPFRRKLLLEESWVLAMRLGPGAFETISGEVVLASLVAISRKTPDTSSTFCALDVSGESTIAAKGKALQNRTPFILVQTEQYSNPDSVVTSEPIDNHNLLSSSLSDMEAWTVRRQYAADRRALSSIGCGTRQRAGAGSQTAV